MPMVRTCLCLRMSLTLRIEDVYRPVNVGPTRCGRAPWPPSSSTVMLHQGTSPSPRLHLRKKRSLSTQHAEDAYWPIGLSTLQRPSRLTSSHPRQISLQQRPTTARPSGPDWRNTKHASIRAGNCGFFVGRVCIGCARTSACLRTHAVRNGECCAHHAFKDVSTHTDCRRAQSLGFLHVVQRATS